MDMFSIHRQTIYVKSDPFLKSSKIAIKLSTEDQSAVIAAYIYLQRKTIFVSCVSDLFVDYEQPSVWFILLI